MLRQFIAKANVNVEPTIDKYPEFTEVHVTNHNIYHWFSEIDITV